MTFLKILALALTALILVPSGAHFFELPHKMALGQDDYFLVQSIYAGWSLFALPIVAAIAANTVLAFLLWRRGIPGALTAFGSAALIVASLLVFFVFIFPANQATLNWTDVPDDWKDLRRNWEYGHAVDFVLVFLAIMLTGYSLAVSGRRQG